MARPRLARKRLAALLRQFPVVTILGPRQIGKSTFARSALPGFSYFDLEDPDDYSRLRDDPGFVLAQSRRIILDEAQRQPELFPVLRSAVDRRPAHKLVVLGSASPSLLRGVSESLAGRTALLELGGISVYEDDWHALWLRGAFPRVHWSRPKSRPEEWYPAYLRTCIEQDIPQLGFRLPAARLRNLLGMLAHTHGGILNLSELGGSLGIDYHAVAHALDVLEGVFLVRRLAPYFANLGKRLVKSPKVYLRDSGMLHSLLGIGFTEKAVLGHPKAGASFEGFCIEQVLLHARLGDPSSQAFFFRTHTGIEVDLLLQLRGRLIPIEIKMGSSIPELRGLQSCMADLGLRRGYVVNRTPAPRDVARGIRMLALHDLLAELRLAPTGRAKASRR